MVKLTKEDTAGTSLARADTRVRAVVVFAKLGPQCQAVMAGQLEVNEVIVSIEEAVPMEAKEAAETIGRIAKEQGAAHVKIRKPRGMGYLYHTPIPHAKVVEMILRFGGNDKFNKFRYTHLPENVLQVDRHERFNCVYGPQFLRVPLCALVGTFSHHVE